MNITYPQYLYINCAISYQEALCIYNELFYLTNGVALSEELAEFMKQLKVVVGKHQ